MDTSVDTLTVMFADVADSTSLYESLGDKKANQIIHGIIQLMAEVTENNSGYVVKTIGDEIMCRFNTADDAFITASVIQEALHNRPRVENIKLRVRIGMHTGQALIREEDNDVFGDAVNVAARVTSIAKGNQIITTRPTVEALSPIFRSSCREFDRIALRGKAQETIIYDAVWGSDDVTRMSTMINLIDTIPTATQLQLTHQNSELSMEPGAQSLSLGRGPQCDLVINSSHASRSHAIIEFRRGKFVIIDQSTNGTFVKTDNGKEVYLRREELPLLGTGIISLGISTDKENLHQIRFDV